MLSVLHGSALQTDGCSACARLGLLVHQSGTFTTLQYGAINASGYGAISAWLMKEGVDAMATPHQ